MKILTLITLAYSASTLAATPDFFPLQVGNRWVLQTAGNKPELLNIEVLRSRAWDGQTYYLVSGYAPGERWLRKDPDGTFLVFDETSGKEATLARLATGAAGYQTSLSGCQQSALPSRQPVRYRSPNFDLANSLNVMYSALSCRDIGLGQEAYAPNVGLVRRSITTIRGEIAYDLVYARVNGSPVLGTSGEIVLSYDFHRGGNGWLAGFADYSLQTSDLRMIAETRPLPDEINPQRSAFYLQSMNRSDDLFMFVKKNLAHEDGIEPNRDYRVWFDIRFASNAPTGCFGVGGAPGDAVYLKAGATADEPVASLSGGQGIRMLIDKGQQSGGGKDAGVVGTIANGKPCEGNQFPYVDVRKEYAHPFPIRTDTRGSLWLLVGTDSGYEGLTGLYVESITVRINPWVEPAEGN